MNGVPGELSNVRLAVAQNKDPRLQMDNIISNVNHFLLLKAALIAEEGLYKGYNNTSTHNNNNNANINTNNKSSKNNSTNINNNKAAATVTTTTTTSSATTRTTSIINKLINRIIIFMIKITKKDSNTTLFKTILSI